MVFRHMHIITDSGEFVKPKDFKKWETKKRYNIMIADKMTDAGYTKRGAAMRDCGTFLQFNICPDCGKSFISSANLCRDRLCPTCSWRLSLKRFAEMCSVMNSISEEKLQTAGFLTLTVRNCKPEYLRFTINKMNEDFNRMMANRKIKAMLSGWAKAVEITYNAKSNTFHPHFHIILLFEEFTTEKDTRIFFHDAWAKACRMGYVPITDFRMITPEKNTTTQNEDMVKAVLETFKYSVKHDELADMPMNTFRKFVAEINGLRFVSFGGIIKEARHMLNFRDDDDGDIEVSKDVCTCGADLIKTICRWSFSEQQYEMINSTLPGEDKATLRSDPSAPGLEAKPAFMQ